ncbi:MAG: hypothetical protein ACJ8EK_03220 [Bradyrhizobium sp.]
MTQLKLIALIILAALAFAPGLAQARTHQHHIRYNGLPYEISYQHNYGPGSLPGTFAYYDGPANNACAQGSASYIGQDRHRHPCF